MVVPDKRPLRTTYTHVYISKQQNNTGNDAARLAQSWSCPITIVELWWEHMVVGHGREQSDMHRIRSNFTEAWMYNNINTTNQNANAIAHQHTRSMPEHTCGYNWLKDVDLTKKKQPYHTKHSTATWQQCWVWSSGCLKMCAFVTDSAIPNHTIHEKASQRRPLVIDYLCGDDWTWIYDSRLLQFVFQLSVSEVRNTQEAPPSFQGQYNGNQTKETAVQGRRRKAIGWDEKEIYKLNRWRGQ